MTLFYRRDGTPYPEGSEGRLEWCRDFQNREPVGYDVLPNGIRVSTVWLGINHNFLGGRPLIFETMLFFGDDSIGDMWRLSLIHI